MNGAVLALTCASLAGGVLAASAAARVVPSATVVSRQEPDLRTIRAALLEADRTSSAVSASRGMVTGFVESLADDVVYLHEGYPRFEGREAVRGFLARDTAYAVATLSRTPYRVDVSSDGTRGYTWGATEIRLAFGAVRHGKYIAFWRAGPAGWRIAAYLDVPTGSPTTPPPPGCETPGAARYPAFPDSGAEPARRAVLAADRRFAALSVARGPGAAFAAYAAPDAAAFIRNSQIVCGRDAIVAGFRGSPLQLHWTPRAGEAAASADLGFTVGEATQVIGERRGHQTYLSIWKRQPTGEWRFVADGGVSRPEPGR